MNKKNTIKMIAIMAIILKRALIFLKMNKGKLKIKKASKKEVALIKTWLRLPLLLEHFKYAIDRPDQGECWICSFGSQPLALIVTQEVFANSPDPFGLEVAPEGRTLLFDVAPVTEMDSDTWGALLQEWITMQSVAVSALLADVEIRQTAIVDAYERAGFVKRATFLKGQGFFKGSSYFLLQYTLLPTFFEAQTD